MLFGVPVQQWAYARWLDTVLSTSAMEQNVAGKTPCAAAIRASPSGVLQLHHCAPSGQGNLLRRAHRVQGLEHGAQRGVRVVAAVHLCSQVLDARQAAHRLDLDK